jgi:hypothetical protein
MNFNQTTFNQSLSSSSSEIFKNLMIIPEVLAILTNFLNILIFSKKDFKDNIFKYLLIYSISEFCYSLMITIMININSKSLLKTLADYFISNFVTSSLGLYVVLIDVLISLQRYLIIANSNRFNFIKNGSPLITQTVLLIVSILFYIPELIFYKIVKDNDAYNLINRDSNNYRFYFLTVNIVRGPILLIIISIINSISLYQFRVQMKNKTNLTIRFKTSKLFDIKLNLSLFYNE